MSYGWRGNYDDRAAARFIPHAGQPEIVWPGRGFHNDTDGGHGCDCVTSSRYDVLARDNPAWAPAVLKAAVAAGMPLMARRIGSAGKYRFWCLCAESPAQAERDGIRLRAERDAREQQRERDDLLTYHAVPVGHQLVSLAGTRIPAIAASLHWHGYSGPQRMLLADGSVQPVPVGCALHNADCCEVAPYRSKFSRWLPCEPSAGHASPWDWEQLIAEREREIIERGRAAKAERRAKSATQPVATQNPFAALAALKGQL